MTVTRLGNGAGSRVTGVATTSWTSFNITSSDSSTVAVVLANLSSTDSDVTSSISSATYGGVAMTLLCSATSGSLANRGAVGILYLFNPPTGPQTIVINAASATPAAVAGMDIAFSGVAQVTNSAALATSQTVVSKTGGYVVRGLSNGAVLSSPNQTSEGFSGSSVSGVGDYFQVQSAAGASSVSFTCSGTATSPLSVAINLLPDLSRVLLDRLAVPTTQPNTTTGTTSPLVTTWTHVADSSAKLAVVALQGYANTTAVALNTITRTVTFGGQTMTSQGAVLVANSTNDPWIEFFTLVNPPTGSQTVSVTISQGTNKFTGTFASLTFLNTNGVASFASTFNATAGTALSHTYAYASAAPEDMVLQIFCTNDTGAINPGALFTMYSHDRLLSLDSAAVSSVGRSGAFNVGYMSPAATSVPFAAAGNDSLTWASIAMDLVYTAPTPATNTGAFFAMF